MVASGIILVVMLRPLFAAKGCVVVACRRQTVAQGHALIINVKFKTAQSAKTLGWSSIVLPVYANNVHKIINALPKKIVFESETRTSVAVVLAMMIVIQKSLPSVMVWAMILMIHSPRINAASASVTRNALTT